MSGSGRYSAARGNLSLLQDVMKRDPAAYRPEFQEQYVHYRQSLGLFRLRPEDLDTAHLIDLLNFIANVSHHFKEDCGDFGPELMELLRSQGPQLEADLRLALVKAVILLRNRRLIPAKDFYVLVFDHLLKCRDRSLRKFAVSSVLAHVKSINAVVGKREGKLSGELEAFVISKLSDAAPIVVRSALLVLIQAYRKGFWKDARLANVIAEAALHANVKIRVTAIKFLLGMRKDGREEDGSEDEESDSEDDGGPEPSKSVKEIMVGLKAGKKTKKRKKAAEKAKQALLKDNKKTGRKRQPVTAAGVCSIALIQDLYDPHEFAERLFKSLSKGKGNDRFEVKLLVMGLCAKVVGIHKLQLLQFYSYLQKYAQPHQREVTKILLYAAQAAHELVPPETIGDLVRAIADAFVTDRNAPEVMTVGLNAIRSVLANAPLAVDEDLLRDLTEYKRYRNKNVSVAARSLIGLFREINPRLLHRKDRGRPTEEVAEAPPPPSFGQGNTNTAVPGAEALLPSAKKSAAKAAVSEGGDEDEWEDVDESEDDGSGDELDWDNAEELPLSDSDSPEPTPEDAQGRKLTKEEERAEASAAAEAVSSGRILTQEDFRAIAVARLRKKMEPARRKRKRPTEEEESEEGTEVEIDDEDLEEAAEEESRQRLPRLQDITHLHKRPKMDRAARLESVQEGREGREKFGAGGKKKHKPHAGKTNRNQAKNKVFSMVKQKQKTRNRNRSFRQRQQSLKDYLTKQKKMR